MGTEPGKRAYQKPAVERIDLVGEEAAQATNCKRDNGGGQDATFPNPCAITGPGYAKCKTALGS